MGLCRLCLKTLRRKQKAGYRKWMKRQMNKAIRLTPIEEDDKGIKTAKKQYWGWDW